MDHFTSVRRPQVGFLVTFASLALMLATPVAAQVKAGDFITPENGSKVKDLVSPGVYYKVQHGMTMKVECAAIGHSLKRRSVRNGRTTKQAARASDSQSVDAVSG